MDVALGPWKADHTEHKPLAEVMGDEAWKTVEKTTDFTPKKTPKEGVAKGYTIWGRLTSVVKEGNSVQIFSTFTVLVDGAISNVRELPGTGSGQGRSAAEDLTRAITEAKVKQILEAIKKGRVSKLG
jgi:hypothetical protein